LCHHPPIGASLPLLDDVAIAVLELVLFEWRGITDIATEHIRE
jgi:hypothetical protein